MFLCPGLLSVLHESWKNSRKQGCGRTPAPLFSGLSWSFRDLLIIWWNSRTFETEEECHTRTERFLADLIARHGDREGQPEQRVAIFSHGGFFVHLMFAILNTPWRQAAHGLRSWFVLNNCSISRIDFHQDGVNIAYLNRTDHLPDHLIT
jgi:broad specificity phosphatase PhoE